jgi:signal transduction histidine kinase/CheY-like chemotaxis protein
MLILRDWRHDHTARTFLIAAVTVAAFASVLGLELYVSRQSEIDAAVRVADNLARVLERQAQSTIEKIDVALRHSVHELTPVVTGVRKDTGTERELKVLLSAIPESQSLRILGPDGHILFDADGFRSPISVADRAYFAMQRDNPSAGLVLSEPIFGRFTSNWVITVSRRFSYPDGRFAGLVQAAVRADHFAKFYQSLAVGGGSVALYDRDSRLIARIPRADDVVGKSLGRTVMGDMMSQNATTGVFELKSRVDGVERLHVFRAVEGLPLVVLAGVAKSDALAAWRDKAALYAVACMLFALGLWALVVSLQKQYVAALHLARVKADFLANMSHEIRTPMNAILGIAHLMRSEQLTNRQAEQLAKIDRSANHLLNIINDILDLSKIETGKLRLEEVDVDLDAILVNVRSILSDRLDAKRLGLVIECEPIGLPLVGDQTRLSQALLNYAGNAVKFSERGTIVIRIRKQSETENAVVLRFEVIDQGIGIAPQEQERLFSAFEQADSSTSRKYGGSGLGLAITKRLAQLMNGEVGLTSVPGSGSTFWFTAQLKKGALSGEPLSMNDTYVESAAATLRRLHAGSRVLLAEDDPVNREIAFELLRAVELEVDTAENGTQAVKMAQATQYALILLDMQMPEMDGLEAAQRIRNIEHAKSTPILALTANVFSEDKDRCLDAGMNDHLAKPIFAEALYRAILRWLGP